MRQVKKKTQKHLAIDHPEDLAKRSSHQQKFQKISNGAESVQSLLTQTPITAQIVAFAQKATITIVCSSANALEEVTFGASGDRLPWWL